MRSKVLRSSPPQHHRITTFSESLMEEDIEVAESFISKWNADTSGFASVTSLFFHDRDEAKRYLHSVNNLQAAMSFFVSHNPYSQTLVRAQSLMQLAMKRLQKEFYQILSANRQFLDPESVSVSSRASTVSDWDDDSDLDDSRPGTDSVSATAMADLKSIADCMISNGYGKECVKIYKLIRKSIVDETLYRLGVERLSFSQIQKMDWDDLELRIKAWLNAVKVSVKTLFYGERCLCDFVFSSSASVRESCFSEIAKEGALTLFGFPELVAKSMKSPEKMFRTLDLYEGISLNWSEIESIFSSDSFSTVRTQAWNSLVRLGDAVRTMLADFEEAVQKDTSKKPYPGGGVHPATRYITNYIQLLAEYSDSLADILADRPFPQAVELPDSYIENCESTISVRFAWLVLVLLCKVDGKAELYKDASLSYLFLANNLQYIVVKVRSSNLKYLLGDDWIAKHEAKVKQYAASYERIGWNKVVATLPAESEISAEEAQECFRRFNAAFDEAYRKQVSWVVTDSKLRDEMMYSLARKLVPAYRVFYQKYRTLMRGEIGMECVRYSPVDLDNYLSDLFYGSGDGGSVSSSTSSTTTSHASTSPSRGAQQPR